MGEYARYQGEEVKIGTCEDMLYLRWDQAHLITALPQNTDPLRDIDEIRFRFPFPDEDGTPPGGFNDPDRGWRVDGVTSPAEVEHGTVQFTARNGYLMNVPCPESTGDNPFKVHKNGYGGATCIVQQRWLRGRLVVVMRCNGCGTIWRLPELADAQPVIDALHDMADAKLRMITRSLPNGDEFAAVQLRTIADRVAAGYAVADEMVDA